MTKSVRFDAQSQKSGMTSKTGKSKPKVTMNPLFIQIENLQNEMELEEKKTFDQTYEEFLQFLEVHDP